MHKYFIRTPWIVRWLYGSYVWRMPGRERVVYISFDDGPHPEVTPWVLDRLKEYEAEASFFCIGNNVRQFPSVYERIVREGHAVGNHTFHHLNGWETPDAEYINDVVAAAELMPSRLFRPPYGRIRRRQAKKLASILNDPKIIMWDVLSADFDRSFSPAQCFDHVVRNVRPGSIIVFHDSEKAWPNLLEALPKTLEFLKRGGYKCKKIEL